MDFQLVIVIALAVASAAYLVYRMFGSLGSSAKAPAGCAGCSAVSSCGIATGGRIHETSRPRRGVEDEQQACSSSAKQSG